MTTPKPHDGAMPELLPCPFCGGAAELASIDDADSDDFGGEFIQCIHHACAASSMLIFPMMADAKPLLIEKWNRRAATQQADQERVATMQEAMRQGTAHFYATCKTGLNGEDGALMRALELVYKYGRGSSAAEPRESGSVVGSIPTSGHPIQQAAGAVPKMPTVPDNMQDWAGMDGTTAWHLIERHADNWADIGKMMDEWLAANSQQPDHLAGGECGGVKVPLTELEAYKAFLFSELKKDCDRPSGNAGGKKVKYTVAHNLALLAVRYPRLAEAMK